VSDEERLRSTNRSLCEALADAQSLAARRAQRCQAMSRITEEAEQLLMGLLVATGPERMSIGDRRVLIQVAERLQRVRRVK